MDLIEICLNHISRLDQVYNISNALSSTTYASYLTMKSTYSILVSWNQGGKQGCIMGKTLTMAETLIPRLSSSPPPVRSLTAWTTETLRRAIVDGYFEPGERLDQDALTEELQVSRTPVREAIAALEAEGLLESRPHRGVFVTEVTEKDIGEVYALRALLEAEVVRESAPSIPNSVLDKLEVALKEAQLAHRRGDSSAQFEVDNQFHTTLWGYTSNDLLREVLEGLSNRINAVRRFAQGRPGQHVEEFAEEHLVILEAIQQRNPQRAADLMKNHLQNSGRRVQELLKSDGT